MRHRYNSFGSYVRKAFGVSVHKVNIDAGFTCPNRDGTLGVGGCIYCNNESFKPGACRSALPVREQVARGIEYVRRRYKATRFLAYFQAYTNTYADVGTLRRLYMEALEDPGVIGLAIGTRPDCIDPRKLDLLEEIARDRFVLVEYGLQSIYDKTLRYINRGHDYAAFLKALRMTRERGINAGAHIIVGLPTEGREETLAMADEISERGVRFLKIHQLQVVRGTPMAGMYEREPFHVFGYGEYLGFLAEFIERLSPEVVLQRLFAAAPDEMLIAPRWNRAASAILLDIDRELERRGTHQGRALRSCPAVS